MKKIFLAVLVAFGAVNFSFGYSYEQCVNMAKRQCELTYECKTAECKANCVRWTNDCHSEDAECREYCEKNSNMYADGYRGCYDDRCRNYWLRDSAPGLPR